LKNSTTSILVISSLELWISGKIQFIVRSLRFLQIPGKSFGPPSLFLLLWHLPCSSSPLLPVIRATHRCSCSSPVPPSAAFASTRRPQPGHRPSSSSLALSHACHAAPWLCRPPPCRCSSYPCTPPRPLSSGSRALPAPSLPIPLPLLLFTRSEPRTPPPPPSSTPAILCPSWAAAVRLPLPTTTPWEASPHLTDAPKPLPVARFPPEPPRRRYRLASKLLSPSNLYLCPFSVQSDHPNSFPSSCCSYRTRAWPPSLPGSHSPTSSSALPLRPLWEPHLRPSPLPPKPTPGCALSSWCSWASPSSRPIASLTGIWLAMLLPSSPTSQGPI
jgi:hypothetical protein